MEVKLCPGDILIGKKSISIREGGLEVPGFLVSKCGDKKDSIVVANACAEVSMD